MAESGCRLILDGGMEVAGWGEFTTTRDVDDSMDEVGYYSPILVRTETRGSLTILRGIACGPERFHESAAATYIVTQCKYAGLPLQPGPCIRPGTRCRFEADMTGDYRLAAGVIVSGTRVCHESVSLGSMPTAFLTIETVDFFAVADITRAATMPEPTEESAVCTCPAADWEHRFWGLKPEPDGVCPIHGSAR